ADIGLGMRDFTGLLTLIGSDAVDNSMGRIAIDPLSFMMSVISSFGLIGLSRNLLKQAIGKYNCEALRFDTRGIMSTYKNPFNNEFYNIRGLIRCRVLTENGLENVPGGVRSYFLSLRGVRAWKDKVVVYADIKKSIKTIYWKLGVLAVVTVILLSLRLLSVIRVVDLTGFAALMTYVNAVLLGLFGFSVWFNYIRTIFDGESEDDNAEELGNKPKMLTRILAGFAMITSIISYTAILSLLQYSEPSDITIWLLVECVLCLIRMIVWASPKVKALLAPTSDCPIQPIEENDENVWKRKSCLSQLQQNNGAYFQTCHLARILKIYIPHCVQIRISDTVFEDLRKEYTNNLLIMNNIGLREFNNILGIPEWALGKDNTAIGKYLNHYGHEMWIMIECPGDPYDLNIPMPRPKRQITKKGYSLIKGQWYEMDIIGIAKQQGVDVDPKDIGEPRPCNNPFTIKGSRPKIDMSGAPKYSD
ncbi:18276_t:CDS:2, partial [Racocetra fulgida]